MSKLKGNIFVYRHLKVLMFLTLLIFVHTEIMAYSQQVIKPIIRNNNSPQYRPPHYASSPYYKFTATPTPLPKSKPIPNSNNKFNLRAEKSNYPHFNNALNSPTITPTYTSTYTNTFTLVPMGVYRRRY